MVRGGSSNDKEPVQEEAGASLTFAGRQVCVTSGLLGRLMPLPFAGLQGQLCGLDTGRERGQRRSLPEQ